MIMRAYVPFAALCAAVVTLFGAATIGAQAPASAPAAKADKKGGPLFSVSHDATLQGDGTTGHRFRRGVQGGGSGAVKQAQVGELAATVDIPIGDRAYRRRGRCGHLHLPSTL